MSEPVIHTPVTLRELATGWRWSRLEDVCTGVFDCPHSTPVLTEAGPFVVRSQDVRTGVFRPEQAAHVSDTTYQERIVRAEPRHSDLFFSREGTYFGIAAEVPWNTRVCLGQRMVLLRPDPAQMDCRFLRCWLNSPIMVSYMNGFRDGSVAERLNMPTIRALPVLAGPVSEQRAIADVLGTLEDKVALNRRMNETLDAIARAIYKSWFVDFDPVRARPASGQPTGMSAENAALFPARFGQSELGDIPAGWRVCKLAELAEITDCLHSKKPARIESGKTLLQLWNIRDDALLDMSDPYYISSSDYAEWTSRMEATTGDCVITNVGRVGAVAQIPTGFKAALGRNMTGIRCLDDCAYPTFLVQALTSSALRDEILLKTDSGTILDSLNVRNIPQLRLVRPPTPLLEAFERKCRPMRARMENNIQESSTLATLRDTLLPKLLSGEIRVKQAEKAMETAL